MAVSDEAADRFARLVGSEAARLSPRTLLGLLSMLLGDRVQVGDASRYIFEYGRRAGYDLPPYPLAGCGEIREFFADEGVASVPAWYERKLGVPADLYAALPARTIVVARDAAGLRRAFVLDGVRHAHDIGFANLADSGLARTLGPAELEDLLGRIMAFLLGEDGATDGAAAVAGAAPERLGSGAVRFASLPF